MLHDKEMIIVTSLAFSVWKFLEVMKSRNDVRLFIKNGAEC